MKARHGVLRHKTTALLAVVAMAVALVPSPSSARRPWPGRAPYSIPTAQLDAALDCDGGLSTLDGSEPHEPVLLTHGTFANPEVNWSWNYQRVLPTEGFEVCWVTLPSGSMGDAQITAEYVARAIEVMSERTGEKVDGIGHSQGGLQLRWAIKWFASGARVDDWIGLASVNHGTTWAGAAETLGMCFESCWQMRPGSNFLDALNATDETPGPISYTSIYTMLDELVQPWTSAELEGGRNILLQDVCPGRPAGHNSLLGDEVVHRLVIDALTNEGPAEPDRLAEDTCTTAAMSGLSAPNATMPEYEDTRSDQEPPLRRYAR